MLGGRRETQQKDSQDDGNQEKMVKNAKNLEQEKHQEMGTNEKGARTRREMYRKWNFRPAMTPYAPLFKLQSGGL